MSTLSWCWATAHDETVCVFRVGVQRVGWPAHRTACWFWLTPQPTTKPETIGTRQIWKSGHEGWRRASMTFGPLSVLRELCKWLLTWICHCCANCVPHKGCQTRCLTTFLGLPRFEMRSGSGRWSLGLLLADQPARGPRPACDGGAASGRASLAGFVTRMTRVLPIFPASAKESHHACRARAGERAGA